MTWQAGVRGCSDFYPAADVSHGPGHLLSPPTDAATVQPKLSAPPRGLPLQLPASPQQQATPDADKRMDGQARKLTAAMN
jgi:hypothetical protein